jgi:hypothetical protein
MPTDANAAETEFLIMPHIIAVSGREEKPGIVSGDHMFG